MTYNLNLIPGKVPIAVHVKQYDTAPREVTFNLHYGDTVYTIPSSVTITVSGTKPDGNGFAYNVTDFSGSTVTVPMEEQMTVLAGEIPCQLTIAQTSGVIGTATFTLCVEPAALSSDTPVSDTELAAFQQMLTQTQQEAAGVAGATAQIATNASNIAANAAAISSLNSKFHYYASTADLYNAVSDSGYLLFTGNSTLYQGLTQTTSSVRCYGLAVLEPNSGGNVSFAVIAAPGTSVFCGRLTGPRTIGRLVQYTGTSIV